MNKKAIILASVGAVVILSCSAFYVYTKKGTPKVPTLICPVDTMSCPDGSTVPRSGPNCEFGVCSQEVPSYMINPNTTPTETGGVGSSTITSSVNSSPKNIASPIVTTNVFTKITSTISHTAGAIKNTIVSSLSSGVKDQTSTAPVATTKPANTSTTSQPPTTEDPSAIKENRLNVVNNSIVDEQGNVIYTIPSGLTGNSSTPGWTTHIVDVIAVNDVPPVINSIPITGSPGKYYLSENSFGNVENCEFSNRIYILDTKANTKTLMYEENNTTLTPDDPRACTSEIYLLATEVEKLILKYHTIGTNTTCDSSWNEPEKTWYLDVTNIGKGMKHYYISYPLYLKSQDSEASCRTQYESTSTPPEATVGG